MSWSFVSTFDPARERHRNHPRENPNDPPVNCRNADREVVVTDGGQRASMMTSSRLRRTIAFVFISVLVWAVTAPFRLQGAAFVAVAVFGALIPFVVLMRLWPDNPDAPWRIFSTFDSAFDRGSAVKGILAFLGITAFATITMFHEELAWPIFIVSLTIYLVVRRRRARSLEADASDTR